MVNATEFREIALALETVTEHPHFDFIAFKARRIFATLAPDGLTANIRFSICRDIVGGRRGEPCKPHYRHPEG